MSADREAGIRARLIANHPLQYGIRHLATEDHPFGETVFDPGDDETIGERYNRCPTCEQWSPCDVRMLLARLAELEAARRAATADRDRLREALDGADSWLVNPEGATIHLPPEWAAELDAALASLSEETP